MQISPSKTESLSFAVALPFNPSIRRKMLMPSRTCLGALLAAGLAFGALGCAHQPTVLQPLRSTVLVMDFDVSDRLKQAPHTIDGWWMGARSEFRNANAGKLFSESLTREMRPEMDWVSLFDPLYLRKYFAEKRRLLEQEFSSELSALDKDEAAAEIERLLAQVSPSSFAKELGADQVLTGSVVESRTYFQRTFRYWTSKVEIECALVDVNTGETLWSCQEAEWEFLDSQKEVMDVIARKVVERMKKEYYFAPPGN
jgi:hypothetical protein